MRPFPRISIVVQLGIMAALFLSSACRKEKKAPETAALLGLDHGLVGYPGSNPEKTKAYLQSLQFVTDSIVDGPVTCEAGDDCGGAASVRLKILPEANAHRYDIASAFGPGTIGGFILAIVVNTDSSHSFGPLSLAPGDTAYLWAGSTQNAGKVFGFYKIRSTGQAEGVAKAASGAYCAASGPRTKPAVHIPMYQCQSTAIYGSSSTVSSPEPRSLYRLASNTILAATMLHTQGLWISCSLGCCQVSSVAPAPL
ncbi:MAG TPA: hypothetical protein VM099_00770 [Gemmatimonadaceae bacterium]|nr:hypothetical protein [Gemmatimonadaceae bacterium]